MTQTRDIAIFQVGAHSDALLPDGTVLSNVHSAALCAGQTCWLHTPTEHGMRDWPINLRTDRGFMLVERTCPHGVGHPDPDQRDYLRTLMRDARALGVLLEDDDDPDEAADAHFIHGCDGCCHAALFPDS